MIHLNTVTSTDRDCCGLNTVTSTAMWLSCRSHSQTINYCRRRRRWEIIIVIVGHQFRFRTIHCGMSVADSVVEYCNIGLVIFLLILWYSAICSISGIIRQ